MGSIAITNGTLVDGVGTRRADLLIQNGVIAEVGEKLDGDTIIDADGLVVTPGFVDLQVHFREPGGEEAETIQTGSRGAALGGFTAVVVMPNTTPTIDSAAVVRQIQISALTPSVRWCRRRRSPSIAMAKRSLRWQSWCAAVCACSPTMVWACRTPA